MTMFWTHLPLSVAHLSAPDNFPVAAAEKGEQSKLCQDREAIPLLKAALFRLLITPPVPPSLPDNKRAVRVIRGDRQITLHHVPCERHLGSW